ncbi:MAG: DUF6128 domain-containing protein [Coprococcus sp.]
MADYRRFISYMYLYENGRKTVNSGFVRVESRNGQCRVHIHMTGLYGPESESYEVFMLIRETGGYIGVDAGSLRIRQQVGELDLSTDSSRLMGTDYSLDRVSGMVVLSDGGKLYGTRWDDEMLETECFVSIEKLSENLVLFSVKKEKETDPIPGTMAAGSLPEIEDSMENVPELKIEDNTENAVNEQDAMSIEGTEEEAVQMTDQIVETEVQREKRQELPNAYEILLQQFPQMYPFEDNSIEICVRLDLQDIGMLPMQCWLYGSNSFLLHGYYCYRHLILARTRTHTMDGEDGVPDYILGVPGIWQHREQYMASMFGFENFKPVSSGNLCAGAFGYWFVSLK